MNRVCKTSLIIKYYLIGCKTSLIIKYYLIGCKTWLIIQYYLIGCKTWLIIKCYLIGCKTWLIIKCYLIGCKTWLIIKCYLMGQAWLIIKYYLIKFLNIRLKVSMYVLIDNNIEMDIVMMGALKAGRTSIAKVIFQKMVPKQTQLLGETTKVQSYDFKIQKIQFKLYDFPARYDIQQTPPNEQMILKNASALIFVLNPQSDTFKALDDFQNIYHHIKKKNTNNCSIFIFINKADIQLSQPQLKNDFQLKHKKRISEDGIDYKEIDFHFTSIFDYSIFQAFSKVLQRMIPCSPFISKMLTQFSNSCKIEKVFLFDLITKLYIATNDEKSIESNKYQVCSQILDIFIDISLLYENNNKQVDESQNKATIKLNYEDSSEIIGLKSVQKYLVLVFIVKDVNYDRPYLIDKNIAIFKEGLINLLSATVTSLK